MELIYRGIFYDRLDVQWDIRILRNQTQAPEAVGVLDFPDEEPLLIEWDEHGKEEVICGSRATLKLMSPGDRTYIDLYSDAPGEIRLDVLKEGVLYWSGTLDPEFYEEPYSTLEDYEVSLTFSDFGIFGRRQYDMAGMKTLRELLDYCLTRSGINVARVDETLISTRIGLGSSLSLSDLSVRSDNFYDEDGEPLYLNEVLEGVLQPLALKVMQRGGVVWVYDLNGLYAGGRVEKVEWMSDDQMLGVDRVYSEAKVTWSPYAQSGVLTEKDCYVEDTDPNITALNRVFGEAHGNSRVFSYHYSRDLVDWVDATDCGFSLWASREGKNAEIKEEGARFFKIVPHEDGQKSEGIALLWPGVMGERVTNAGGYSVTFGRQENGCGFRAGYIGSGVGRAVWKSQEVWIPPVKNGNDLRVRIAMNLLMDCRFNPFESAENLSTIAGEKEKDWYDQWNKRGNFVYIPVTLKFQPDGSNNVYCWTNQGIVRRGVNNPVQTLGETLGTWEPYDLARESNPLVYGYFCWYDVEDRAEKSGVLGWRKNRPAINPHKKRLVTALGGAEDGQYVPYPTFGSRGGKLWLEIRLEGWMLSDGGVNLSTEQVIDTYGLWQDGKALWCLMELPEIEVIKAQQYDTAINTDDVEYKATLNGVAKEPIEIETICGTVAGGLPTARGAYFKTSDLTQVERLTRAGRTSQVEELLIGTLYSQFAERKTRLEGTTELPSAGLCLYREAMQGDRRFLLTGAVEDVQNETCESVLVELRPDEYDKEV